MIISTEFLDRHICAISCMEGIFESSRGVVRILGRNKAIVDANEAKDSTPKPHDDKTMDPDKATIT